MPGVRGVVRRGASECMRIEDRGAGPVEFDDMEHPEKDRLICSLKAGEEFSRRTGRTTQLVGRAVDYIFEVGEPVMLVGASKETMRTMMDMAHRLIDERASSGDAGRLRGLVSGVTHKARDSTLGTPPRMWFEDHFVWYTRAVEAIENL